MGGEGVHKGSQVPYLWPDSNPRALRREGGNMCHRVNAACLPLPTGNNSGQHQHQQSNQKEVSLCAKKRMDPHVPRKRVGTARRTRTRRKSNHHTHNDTGANRAPVWSSAVLNDASDICLIEVEPGGTDRRASQRQQSYNYAGAPTFRASSAHHLANSVRKGTMSNATRLFCMRMKNSV